MISVAEALDHILTLCTPVGTERVPLRRAAGRVLAEDAVATRTQPPFAASAMDGYAVRGAEVAPGALFRVIGTAQAGARFASPVGPGEAVRIFTGAPVPDGADRIVIQEDVTPTVIQEDVTPTVIGTPDAIQEDVSPNSIQRDGTPTGPGAPTIRVTGDPIDPGPYIRPAGGDFAEGARIPAPRRLRPADIALLAAMGCATVTVRRPVRIALIATGDELVWPGEAPGPDQIVTSNNLGLAARFEAPGTEVRLLPIARDSAAHLGAVLDAAEGDLVVTLGGASVGDHDLVARVAEDRGAALAFQKVAMRPGKPLMAGRFRDGLLIGLPGNPVSAMVCGEVFLRPAIDALSGRPAAHPPLRPTRLAAPMGPNGPRAHYMRATLGPDGVTPAQRQDSSLLSVLAAADALLVRPPHDAAREAGDSVDVLDLGWG